MKNTLSKIADFISAVFGYGIMICLFAGGLTFFGYVAALIIGGETAALICEVIYKTIIPKITYASTSLVLVGLFYMYLTGEKALTAEKEKNVHHDVEH